MPVIINNARYRQTAAGGFNPTSSTDNLIFTLSEEAGASMTNVTREDPFKQMNFVVGFKPFDSAGAPSPDDYWYGFASMSGLKWDIEKIAYRESGDDNFDHSSPGKGTFDPIVLRKGTGKHWFLYQWARRIVQNNAKDDTTLTFSPTTSTTFIDYRCHHMKLIVRDSALNAGKAYKIYSPWVRSFELGEMDAMGNDVLFETVEIEHEGFQQFVVDYTTNTVLWDTPVGMGTDIASTRPIIP